MYNFFQKLHLPNSIYSFVFFSPLFYTVQKHLTNVETPILLFIHVKPTTIRLYIQHTFECLQEENGCQIMSKLVNLIAVSTPHLFQWG